MGSTAATMLLLGFLVPTLAVFVISYRHAMRTWLAPRSPGAELPVATVVPRMVTGPGSAPARASHDGRWGGGRAPGDYTPLARRFHAAVIAIAFASVFTMGLIAVAMVATAIAFA